MTHASTSHSAMPRSGCTNLDIINAQLPGYEGLHWLRIDRYGFIEVIQPMRTEKPPVPCIDNLPAMELLDVSGDWISLGGVDLQINGGLGLGFPDLELTDLAQLEAICQFLWEQGVDAFLPTLVTTSIDKIHRAIATLAEFFVRQQHLDAHQCQTARILGVHLEGPFLNPDKRGAHPEQFLLPLTVENVKQVLGNYPSLIKVMTLAPELDPTGAAISYLRSQGIVVSLGHSLASAQTAQEAFDCGATMVTHAFNAMPSLHHRQPGLLGAAIVNPNIRCGLIADGEHVSPIMIDMLLCASKYQQGIFLVSDALSPLGLPDGLYPWDDRQIEVKNGTARLLDGTLAGTTEPLLSGVQNLVKWGVCDVGVAIALATESPRRAIGLRGLTVGQPANLLRWHLNEPHRLLSWKRLQANSP
ncbi:N-acetylglucosamine-6-phosphate deacetylase [Phormidium sp. CCY1219]|uniref:N-acetylglucosamine-6-phosphate deacetylase n=1 Tax=Phormidium sp. CCY1219 TaxID=2886104 RepID=UPI002D1EDE78|nr:N-acetylglucosamine-6-phosphate deacetylase [Phormidium sp. CCY1219]